MTSFVVDYECFDLRFFACAAAELGRVLRIPSTKKSMNWQFATVQLKNTGPWLRQASIAV